MFIPIESADSAVREFIAWMDTPEVRAQHNPDVYLSAMLRYVAGDDIDLSPMQGRDTAVMSFIVLGDQQQSGDQREFELYSRGLQHLCETQFQGRPHWGKVSYATGGAATPAYLQKAYPDTWDAFQEVVTRMDPNGMFQNQYLQDRLATFPRP